MDTADQMWLGILSVLWQYYTLKFIIIIKRIIVSKIILLPCWDNKGSQNLFLLVVITFLPPTANFPAGNICKCL
jgi:hypothetical protein